MKVIYNNYFLRKITNLNEEFINGVSINDLKKLISYLINKYGPQMEKYLIDKDGTKLKVTFMINGVSVSDSDYKISDSDIINIFQLVGGG